MRKMSTALKPDDTIRINNLVHNFFEKIKIAIKGISLN